jgi:hypothetical protein
MGGSGWDQTTIARDLRSEANASKSEANASLAKTGSAAKILRPVRNLTESVRNQTLLLRPAAAVRLSAPRAIARSTRSTKR